MREQTRNNPSSSSDNFTWIPLYQKIAEKVLEYEGRQVELIAIIREAKELKLPVISLKDKDEKGMTEMSEIDPFSFFASFNRKQTFANKRKILSLFCNRLGLPEPGEISFSGIPQVNNMQSWFLPWQVDRNPGDLSALWALARSAVTGGLSAVDASTFQRCLNVHTVGMAKLTMGLYWMRPDEFFPADANTRALLQKNGVDSTFKDFKGLCVPWGRSRCFPSGFGGGL